MPVTQREETTLANHSSHEGNRKKTWAPLSALSALHKPVSQPSRAGKAVWPAGGVWPGGRGHTGPAHQQVTCTPAASLSTHREAEQAAEASPPAIKAPPEQRAGTPQKAGGRRQARLPGARGRPIPGTQRVPVTSPPGTAATPRGRVDTRTGNLARSEYASLTSLQQKERKPTWD